MQHRTSRPTTKMNEDSITRHGIPRHERYRRRDNALLRSQQDGTVMRGILAFPVGRSQDRDERVKRIWRGAQREGR